MKITIDGKIKNHLYTLSDEEYNQLEENIIEEGIRDPLILWKYNDKHILIDGHHRYKICEKHKIRFQYKIKEFLGYKDVLEWIDRNQIGRRNLTPLQRSDLLGRISKYNKVKGFKGNQYSSLVSDKLSHTKNQNQIAKDLGVNRKSLQRDEKFHYAIEEIKRCNGKELTDKILSGELKMNKPDVISISKMNPFEQEEILNPILKGEVKTLKESKKKLQIDKRKEEISYITTDEFKIDQLYKGDTIEVLKKFPDDSIDMVLTDPPYGISYVDTRTSFNPDYKDDSDYAIELLDNTCKELKRITKPDSHLYFFCGYSNAFNFKEILSKYFIVQDNWITWVKNNHTMCDFDKQYASKYEIIWFCKNENNDRKLNNPCSPDVLQYSIPQNKEHSAQKPEDLLDYLINNSSVEGEIILDTFMGSGSTCKSAKENKRKYIGIELEEDIFNIAVDKLKKREAH